MITLAVPDIRTGTKYINLLQLCSASYSSQVDMCMFDSECKVVKLCSSDQGYSHPKALLRLHRYNSFIAKWLCVYHVLEEITATVKLTMDNYGRPFMRICLTRTYTDFVEYNYYWFPGSAYDAKVTCPSGILGKYDYVYYPKDNSSARCINSKDLWDGCTDKTMVTFNYSTCTQNIAYSGGGIVWCVANIGDTYGVVYNNDSSLVSSKDDKLATYRFSCIVGNHASASIAPGNCTSQQTATSYPVKWNSNNLINDNAGVYLTLNPY
ncbi:hypothetical protein ACJMK2_032225, partial [Sinanodonta woodiana]